MCVCVCVCVCVWALPGGGAFSSAHWKKPHCWSLGFPQVWNVRPLFGPSFCTVRITAVSLQLHIDWPGCSPAPPCCPMPPTGVFLKPKDGLGGWEVCGAPCWLGSSAHRKKLQLPALHLKNWRPWLGPSFRTVRRSASWPQLHTMSSLLMSAMTPPPPGGGGGRGCGVQEGTAGRGGRVSELGALGGFGLGGKGAGGRGLCPLPPPPPPPPAPPPPPPARKYFRSSTSLSVSSHPPMQPTNSKGIMGGRLPLRNLNFNL